MKFIFLFKKKFKFLHYENFIIKLKDEIKKHKSTKSTYLKNRFNELNNASTSAYSFSKSPSLSTSPNTFNANIQSAQPTIITSSHRSRPHLKLNQFCNPNLSKEISNDLTVTNKLGSQYSSISISIDQAKVSVNSIINSKLCSNRLNSTHHHYNSIGGRSCSLNLKNNQPFISQF